MDFLLQDADGNGFKVNPRDSASWRCHGVAMRGVAGIEP
jgi:hypothetical protein